MDDQILTVLNQLVETQKETNKRLDKMDSRFDQVDTRLDKLDSKVTDNTNRLDVLEVAMKDGFDRVDSRFEKVDSRFDKIDSKFEEVDARFDKIDSRFDNLTKDIGNLITKEVGDYISNSLSRMESKIDRIGETTNESKLDIQVIKVAITKHEDDSKYFKKHHLRQV